MDADESQIRQLVATWMAASKAGDTATVLDLMADDVVFLVPGQPPMTKQMFATAARAQAGPRGMDIDGTSDIQEVKIFGEWAFLWSRLSVVVTPKDGSAPGKRAGHTLTLFNKVNGRWLLARDANLLAPVSGSPS